MRLLILFLCLIVFGCQEPPCSDDGCELPKGQSADGTPAFPPSFGGHPIDEKSYHGEGGIASPKPVDPQAKEELDDRLKKKDDEVDLQPRIN
jgi:hypothetical protein